MKQVLFKKFNALKFRLLIVGMLSMVTMLPALAANTAKSIEDVKIKMDFLEGNLEDLLGNIESKTEYKFFYTDQAIVDKDVLTLDRSKGSVADILKDLARLKNLHFKQVNNNISVKFLESKAKNPDLVIVLNEADIAIRGKITDDSGEPIPGVAISVVGTSIGTITNIDGDYSLNVPEDGVLSVSYIGFSTQRIEVNSRSIINITLVEAIAGLDEVVVTALGIKREAKSLGYATSTVASDEMTINRTPIFINSLQGKVAGVNITSMGSGPQGSSKIRIRGVSSFGGNNSPLIVVNGVPIDNTNFGVSGDVSEVGSNRKSDSGDGLSSINPDDITSMSVLKGAAASALYGARAKDGVIMITTRNRASGSGIQIELNTNYTNDTPLDYTNMNMDKVKEE